MMKWELSPLDTAWNRQGFGDTFERADSFEVFRRWTQKDLNNFDKYKFNYKMNDIFEISASKLVWNGRGHHFKALLSN